MSGVTKRVAAEKVIAEMNGDWVRLKDLAARACCGKYSLSKMEMARFLSEHDELEKRLVYVGGCGASLQRRVYRKKKGENKQ